MGFLKKHWKWILLIVIVAIIIFLFIRKKKAQDPTRVAGEAGAAGAEYRGVFTLGRFDHKEGQEVAVTLKERPAMGTIVANDTIVIENAGPYSGTFNVKKPWQDGSGQLGAIFIDIPGSENLPNTTREYAYDSIGKINLI